MTQEIKNELKYRMYFFVPYNISPIQQAIQAGHAALEYAVKYYNTANRDFIDFMKNDKTWIILNGGTTNSKGKPGANYRNDPEPYRGSLDNIAQQLTMNDIKYSLFFEPDLNDALTAVCFLADERVWDWENYPSFDDYLISSGSGDISYEEWVKKIGGEKNVFLKELIRGKKLA